MIFDSGLKGDDFVSFVATDNVKGGRLGGEHLAQALGGKGKVVLLRYAEGHDSTGKREEGFLEAMKAQPGHRGGQLEPVRRRRRRGRLQEERALLSALQEAGRLARHRRHLLAERVVDVRACCACCRTTAGRAR